MRRPRTRVRTASLNSARRTIELTLGFCAGDRPATETATHEIIRIVRPGAPRSSRVRCAISARPCPRPSRAVRGARLLRLGQSMPIVTLPSPKMGTETALARSSRLLKK
jgi:hypothetical protein